MGEKPRYEGGQYVPLKIYTFGRDLTIFAFAPEYAPW